MLVVNMEYLRSLSSPSPLAQQDNLDCIYQMMTSRTAVVLHIVQVILQLFMAFPTEAPVL